MTDLEIARDLRAAAEYLRTHGWRQGDWEGPDGSVCLAGALLKTGSWQRAHVDALGLGYAVSTVGVGQWNDTPGRTIDEVLDRLESAALNLEIRALAESVESLAAERLEMVPSA